MTIKWQDIAMLLVAAFLLGLLLAQASRTTSNDTIREKEIIRARPDTVRSIVEVQIHPLRTLARANRIRTVAMHDTIYRERCLDTLLSIDTAAIAPDTLSVCYARNTFALSLGLAARRKSVAVPYLAHDTFYWRQDSIRVQAASSSTWLNDALLVIVSLAAGIIVGKL